MILFSKLCRRQFGDEHHDCFSKDTYGVDATRGNGVKLGEKILELLFPRVCPVCGQIVLPKGELICPPCRKKISYVTGTYCMKCGKTLLHDTKEYCRDCSRNRRSFKRGIILANYTPEVQKALLDVKYHNLRQNLDFFAAEIIRLRGKQIAGWQAQALIPVPLHPSKRRQRGFNQTEELCRRLSAGLQLPVDTSLLYRRKKTLPQKGLTNRQRMANLAEAFVAERRTEPYHTVILVDDIYTTGSTAELCTRALMAAGVETVYVLCVAAGVVE